MFGLDSCHRFLLYSQPTDMRKSFDGLSGIVRNHLLANPQNGDVFLFINKERDKIKLLHWTAGGYVLYYKQLEKGRFELGNYQLKQGVIKLDYARLAMLIDGLSIKNIHQRKRYSPTKK